MPLTCATGIDVTAGSYARGMARYVPEPDSPSLFDAAGPDGSALIDDPARPLADRLRPRTLDDVVGQDQLLADDAPLGRMVASGRLSSIILWGPPGCGKTTIARLLADRTGLVFEQVSATFSGVADLRKVFAAAARRREIGRARSCSSTRSTASTAPNRTPSCPTSRTGRSSWSVQPPRTRASSSTAPSYRAARSWSCAAWTRPP